MTTTATPYADPAALAAVEEARAALVADLGRDAHDVGDHLGHLVEADGVVTHLFACTRKGYVGWRWSVTVAHVEGGPVTVDELVLIPGEEAIVAPAWVPYRERIKPGDLGPGDLLPVGDDDARLVPTYSFGDDPLDADAKAQVRQVAQDLGLGRSRTLSPEGYDLAAERWYDGVGGPQAPIAQAAPVATDTAPPDVDPPGTSGSSVLQGFSGVPWCGLMPTPEKANSLMFVWPTSTAPAARRRATAVLSRAAGLAWASTRDSWASAGACMGRAW